MLNYVWIALLFLGIGTALTSDIFDNVNDKYKNGAEFNVQVSFGEKFNKNELKKYDAEIIIPAEKFNVFYKTDIAEDIKHNATITINPASKKTSLFLKVDKSSPAIWKDMAKVNGNEDDLSGTINDIVIINDSTAAANILFEEISFGKMKDVTNSALDYAGIAVNIALGLIGIMALWLGVMKVAQEAGLISIIAKSVRPITKFLFPEVPQDHPAMGAMIMNISANMLGLGNAATPFGLKAMEELDKLNPEKGTATNAMCTFLTMNTAGLTLIPATAIAVRAAAGSSDPAIIIGTSIFGASCATLVGITSAKILEKFPLKNYKFLEWVKSNSKIFITSLIILFALAVLIVTGAVSSIISLFNFLNPDLFRSVIQIISILAIPLFILVFIGYGAYKKVKVYEVFVEGAKEGFDVAVKIIPYLVAMLVGIGIFRAGGAMEFLQIILSPVTDFIGMPAEAMPMALMRPLSGSGSLGIMTEIISTHGPDSYLGILVSTFFGSTETTFYVLAVYFGAVNIRKTRHALAAGLLADVAGILAALFIVKLLFG
ncbi:MAG: spore maturation protein [Bacteroidetes bacterium]|nr:spore maturation protein [Bacteroidota bacterium]